MRSRKINGFFQHSFCKVKKEKVKEEEREHFSPLKKFESKQTTFGALASLIC
jgi:hypothetical protein